MCMCKYGESRAPARSYIYPFAIPKIHLTPDKVPVYTFTYNKLLPYDLRNITHYRSMQHQHLGTKVLAMELTLLGSQSVTVICSTVILTRLLPHAQSIYAS